MDPIFPQGFQATGLHCGVKSNPQAEDLTLIVSDQPAVGAGVYTRNLVCAAPVTLDRQRTPGEGFRGVIINSGNANACTAEQGLRDAQAMIEQMASACEFDAGQGLVMSTGIIGEAMPMDAITRGIQQAAKQLGSDATSLVAAARGMMTTDTVPKICCRQFEADGRTYTVTGLAKGAAMIGPNMATMLGMVMTDAPIAAQEAQLALTDAVDESFNCISVDGHMSTNDTVLLLANGAAGGAELQAKALSKFRATLLEVCEDLAQSIPADGEGATHLITVEVHGCQTRPDAVRIARTIADSPLVKTAIHGADPNWGRIVSAAGYAGIPFDPSEVTLLINGLLVYEHGVPVDFDEQQVSDSIRDNRDTGLVLILSEGSESARFWTTDLTAEYVRLNAEYHT